MSPDRQEVLAGPDNSSQDHTVDHTAPTNDVSMEVDVEGAWAERQDRGSNDTNPIESQALPETPKRLPRINRDNPPSRPIRKHRNRNSRSRDRISDHWPGDFYRSREPSYYDRDDLRANGSPRPRRERENSPETLKQKAQSEFVAAMADVDFKDERDDRREDRRDDRRDRGGNRGNNKRRRDGEFAYFPAIRLHS